jgi:prepilin-type N-terminal cleavage/methylation domain-containing protein/prepilin-type processing-associated H-X9-DG protein
MKRKKAFTLIELLVVIAIIALLLSILMPSLQRAKEQAKDVVCKSNLKQWAVVCRLYTNESGGKFFRGWMKNLKIMGENDQWPAALRPYYKNPKLRLCPSATQLISKRLGRLTNDKPQYTNEAWGEFEDPPSTDFPGVGPRDYGSYGINGWVCDPLPETGNYRNMLNAYWRKADVPHASDVPLFLDSYWIELWATAYDLPPDCARAAFDNAPAGQGRSCILRHPKGVNCVYLDGSVKGIRPLKELWYQNWHKGYTTNIVEDYTSNWTNPRFDWLKK